LAAPSTRSIGGRRSRIATQDGRSANVEPFVREELLKPLERWFFGR
jgi:hypothetical protein